MGSGETPAVPQVLWAQRSSATNSKKNIIYLTVILPGIIHPTSEFTITDTSISFEANAKDEGTECKYAFKLDFYAEVVPELLEKCLTSRSITIALLKKQMNGRYWPRLSTAVLAYVETDFNRWTWEGDQADDVEGNKQTDTIGGGDINSKTSSVPLLEQPNELSAGVMSSTFPLVLWAQRGSSTERRKNIIYLTINAQDIVQSTLKCTITNTSISFRAIAREGCEERENAFNLDFYADVEPEALENHLTSQYLTVILLKRQMNARHWPRLQRAEKILPFVGTDFRRWRWEGDHDDDIIDVKMSGGPIGTNCGWHFEQPEELTNRGIFFCRRFKRFGEIGDIEKSISSFGDAVQLTPDGHANKPGRLNNFGGALMTRFERLGEMGDMEKGISILEDAVRLTSDGHANKADPLSNLGNLLLMRFQRLGEMGDMEKGISSLEGALRLTPDGHADKPSLLNNLGTSLLMRFERLGEMGDIEQSTSSLEDAVRLTPDDHADKPTFLSNLGISLRMRFERLGEMGDIEKGISSLEDAVRLTPDGHADMPSRLSNLGNSLRTRFERLGAMGDIEQSISSLEDAVRLTPDGHADKPSRLSNFGSSLLTRFKCLGEMRDMEKGISSLVDAVRFTPDGHADKPGLLSNLGNSLRTRFERLGEMGDMEKGISSLEDAVRLTPDGHADKPGILSNLGNSLGTRFEHLGEMGDIEKGVSSHEDAVRLTPDGHTDKPHRLSNLGSSLLMRFKRLGEMGDIEKGISSLKDAVRLTPDGHADKPSFLSNLGNSLSMHFERLGKMGDIEKGISSLEDAVRLTPDGHADKPSLLNNLGNLLLTRFECLGAMEDIEQSISSFDDAVRLTPDGHADKPGFLSNLGSSLMSRFQRLADSRDLKRSLLTAFESATQLTGPPSVRFCSAISWAERARLCCDDTLPSALQAYATAFELLPRLSWLGLSIASRHHGLLQATTLACDAAATAISANNLYLALEWLEQGRSVLWGQILHLRTPVDDLRATHPKLAEELASIAMKLERGNTQTFLGGDQNKESPADAVQKHREHANKWERVVEKVRELPGFEHFLLPKQYSELRDAARDGPVVVLNASQYGCDALIITSPLDPLHHVRLPDLTYAHAHFLRKVLHAALNKQGLRERRHVSRESEAESLHGSDAFRYLLGQLWELVIKPVRACFESLGLKGDLHIRWCPTGPLAFLPIHAAGIYGEDGTASCSLADFAISSYIPSLSVLLNSSQRKVCEQAGFKLLVIAASNTPGAGPLPGVKEELTCIRKRASVEALSNRSLEGPKATVIEVLSAMDQCSWVHFACHGIQDISDPMNSGLLLEDGLLQLLDIVKKQLPSAEFAFLSACQTATGDENRPEEAIHIAAGMLLAGYRGVVGTMWSIRDDDAPFVANDLYMQLLKGGKPNSAKAAHALHATIHRLRERPDGCPFASWIPFIHMGV